MGWLSIWRPQDFLLLVDPEKRRGAREGLASKIEASAISYPYGDRGSIPNTRWTKW